MKEKRNKSIYIVIGILVVLVVILLALTAFLFLGGKAEKKGGSGNAGPFIVKEKEQGDSDGKVTEEIPVVSGNGIYLVSNGCKVLVPKEYQCLNVAGIGLVVYKDDVFQMKLVVGDGSYEEDAKNPESLKEKAVDAGGKILEPVKETEVDGRKYLYFVMELSGDKVLVIYSQAADCDKKIAGQIVMESDTVTNEDMIQMFAGIAGGAVKTDEPDTTSEDIMQQERIANVGEMKSESTLSFQNASVTVKVPAGYYSIMNDDADDYVSETFTTADYGVEVKCNLRTADGLGINDAKTLVECWFDWLPNNVKKETEIQVFDAEGRTWYYYDVHYKLEETDRQNILVACDLGDKMIYSVEAQSSNESKELTMDSIMDFLSVESE